MGHNAVLIQSGSYANQTQLVALMTLITLEHLGNYAREANEIKTKYGWKSVDDVARFYASGKEDIWFYRVYGSDSAVGRENSVAAAIMIPEEASEVYGSLIVVKEYKKGHHGDHGMGLHTVAQHIMYRAAFLAGQKRASSYNDNDDDDDDKDDDDGDMYMCQGNFGNEDDMYNSEWVTPVPITLQQRRTNLQHEVIAQMPEMQDFILKSVAALGYAGSFDTDRGWDLEGMIDMLGEIRERSFETQLGAEDEMMQIMDQLYWGMKLLIARSEAVQWASSVSDYEDIMDVQRHNLIVEVDAEETRKEEVKEKNKGKVKNLAAAKEKARLAAAILAASKAERLSVADAKKKADAAKALRAEQKKITKQKQAAKAAATAAAAAATAAATDSAVASAAASAGRQGAAAKAAMTTPADRVVSQEKFPQSKKEPRLKTTQQPSKEHTNESVDVSSLGQCLQTPLECWYRFKQAYKRPARPQRVQHSV